MHRYAELVRLAGPWFLVVGFLARLPVAMITIGMLLLVSTTTGSVARGGLATGAAAIGTAVLAPIQGRLADHLGQRPVLLVAGAASTAGLVAATAAAVQHWPVAVLLGACFVAGGAAPQVGALARVRWLALTRARPAPMNAAMSWESTVDEITFVAGPALVGLIGGFRPEAVLLAAAGLVVVFSTAFALHPTAPPARRTAGHDPAAPRTSMPRMVALVAVPMLGMLSMGMFFGSTQAAVTGVATALDRPGVAGLLYSVMGIGSAVTALAVVALPERIGLRRRWVVGATGMAVAVAAALGVDTLGGTTAVLAVTGLFVGPTIVTLFSAGGRAAPLHEAGTGMTLLVSANVVGVAIGAAVAGRVADVVAAAGSSTSLTFGVPVAACLVLALAGTLLRERRTAPSARPSLGG